MCAFPAAAWLAAVVESSDDAIIGKDLTGTIRSWNKAAERIFGYAAEEIVGTSIRRLIPADRQAEEDRILGAIGRGEKVDHFETRRRRKDGVMVEISITASPIRDASGKIVGVSKIARDITAAKARERELARVSRCYAALSQVNQAIVMTAKREELYEKVCRALVDFGGFTLASIGFEDPAAGRIVPAAIWGEPSDYARADGPARDAFRENRAFIRNDMPGAPETLRAAAAFPICLGGRPIGALSVYASEPDFFQEREVALLAEAAGDVSFALTNFARDSERRQADEKVREAEARYRTLFVYAPDGILIADSDSVYLDANPSMCRMLGYAREELIGLGAADIVVEDGANRIAAALKEIRSGADYHREWLFRRKNGSTFPVDVITTMMPDGNLLGLIRDITERKQGEAALRRTEQERVSLLEQLAQAQKMESVGRLAGGVAHDFNNILTAIGGFTELVLSSLPDDDARKADLREVLAAAQRASRLTRQLLAFSRRQILTPQVLDLAVVVSSISKMLGRLIGENITLETLFPGAPCLVKVDPGQIEQVLVNLAVNARDAMPKGGRLTFELENLSSKEAVSTAHLGLPAGPLVRLSVRDTGTGMTDTVKERIFEPFFTTKERGKGTGLGLSTVYGIIKQSGGEIEVDSEPGRGAAFRIYLPHAEETVKDDGGHADKVVVLRGSETILLVEDEDPVRRLVERAIAAYGYTVLAAADGEQALALLERHGAPVDLLITDVVMPGMSGRDLARTVAARKLAPRTLFISGYAEDAIVDHGVLEPGLALLNKPFSPDALLRKLRDVLDGPADQARA